MKDITPKLISMFKSGYAAPQIARIAREIKQPSTTIHYNIKKLERDGAVKAYKAVFDYKKIDQGFCTYILINLSQDDYGDPEKIAEEMAKDDRVESIDICTGDNELILKLRTKDIDEYYEYVKFNVKKYGFRKMSSLTSLKQIKSEFMMQ